MNCPLANPDKDISFAFIEERTEDKPNSKTPVKTREATVSIFFSYNAELDLLPKTPALVCAAYVYIWLIILFIAGSLYG